MVLELYNICKITMLDKIKNYQNHPYVTQFKDMRSLGLLTFLVIVLLVSWSGVKAIEINYKLQKQISQLQQEIAVQQLKNNNLKLKNGYYNTPQYLELAARQSFGLAAPGEKELIVPKDVALAHTVNLTSDVQTVSVASKHVPFYQRNVQAWIDFFLHRQSATD